MLNSEVLSRSLNIKNISSLIEESYATNVAKELLENFGPHPMPMPMHRPPQPMPGLLSGSHPPHPMNSEPNNSGSSSSGSSNFAKNAVGIGAALAGGIGIGHFASDFFDHHDAADAHQNATEAGKEASKEAGKTTEVNKANEAKEAPKSTETIKQPVASEPPKVTKPDPDAFKKEGLIRTKADLNNFEDKHRVDLSYINDPSSFKDQIIDKHNVTNDILNKLSPEEREMYLEDGKYGDARNVVIVRDPVTHEYHAVAIHAKNAWYDFFHNEDEYVNQRRDILADKGYYDFNAQEKLDPNKINDYLTNNTWSAKNFGELVDRGQATIIDKNELFNNPNYKAFFDSHPEMRKLLLNNDHTVPFIDKNGNIQIAQIQNNGHDNWYSYKDHIRPHGYGRQINDVDAIHKRDWEWETTTKQLNGQAQPNGSAQHVAQSAQVQGQPAQQPNGSSNSFNLNQFNSTSFNAPSSNDYQYTDSNGKVVNDYNYMNAINKSFIQDGKLTQNEIDAMNQKFSMNPKLFNPENPEVQRWAHDHGLKWNPLSGWERDPLALNMTNYGYGSNFYSGPGFSKMPGTRN